MAKNFNQAEMLEKNNTASEAKANGFGKVVIYFTFIFIIPIFWFIGKRNWFKRTKEDLMEALSNIDSKLTERYDALTNQMKIAKKALSHEKDIQLGVAKLRSSATSPSGELSGVTERHAELATMTRKWNMVQENYPQVTALPLMEKLNAKVSDLEADLEASRRFYTAVAKKFNSAMVSYPSNVPASGMGLKRFPMFEADDNKRKNVSMDF